MKYYKCIADLQGCGWQVNCVYTTKELRNQFMEYADSDGNYNIYNLLKRLHGQKLVDFIQDIWELEIISISKEEYLNGGI